MAAGSTGTEHGDLVALGHRAFCFAIACTSLHLSLRTVVRKLPCIAPKYRGDWLNRCVSIPHAIVASFLAISALCTEEPAASLLGAMVRLSPSQDYIHCPSMIFDTILPITLGYFLYDTTVMMIDREVYMHLMVVHHVVSLVVWTLAYYYRIFFYYILVMIATEVTTPFLHIAIFFFPKHGLTGTKVHLVLGLCLVAGFFLFRVLPIPFLAYSWWATRSEMLTLSPTLQLIAICTLPVPSILNLYWFVLLVRGALSKLGGGKESDQKQSGKKRSD